LEETVEDCWGQIVPAYRFDSSIAVILKTQCANPRVLDPSERKTSITTDERDAKVPRIGQTRGAAEAVAEKIVNTLMIICE
jgi:hypothetical protein